MRVHAKKGEDNKWDGKKKTKNRKVPLSFSAFFTDDVNAGASFIRLPHCLAADRLAKRLVSPETLDLDCARRAPKSKRHTANEKRAVQNMTSDVDQNVVNPSAGA